MFIWEHRFGDIDLVEWCSTTEPDFAVGHFGLCVDDFSSQRHIRQIWFVGAALLGIVVIKLVILDLSQSGTLTRVVSFIGAGGVMLVIAYLAPLPPASKIADKNDT